MPQQLPPVIYTDEPIAWPEGAFHMLPATTRAASYDLVKGAESGFIILDLGLTGLPKGSEAQVRLAVYKNGKWERSLGATEILGTSGSSLGQHLRTYSTAADESIRAELCTFVDGVTVEKISSTKTRW